MMRVEVGNVISRIIGRRTTATNDTSRILKELCMKMDPARIDYALAYSGPTSAGQSSGSLQYLMRAVACTQGWKEDKNPCKLA